ncbi:MAG: DUF2199 domain-containing protein [Acidobacteriota bacterium]
MCRKEHDIENIEPSFKKPDAVLEIPDGERGRLALEDRDWCAVRDAEDTERHYYLRVLLPVEVLGRTKPCCWGIWVEVSARHYERAQELWDDPRQSDEPPFPGRIANRVNGYPDTLGLPGLVSLTDPATIPLFTLDRSISHPLAQEQRDGVSDERVMEWLMPILHPPRRVD